MRKDVVIGVSIFAVGVGAYFVARHFTRKKKLNEAFDFMEQHMAEIDTDGVNIINKKFLECLYNHPLTDKNKFYELYIARAEGYKTGKEKIIVNNQSLNTTTLKDDYGKLIKCSPKKDKYYDENCKSLKAYGEDCKKLLTNYKKV